VKFLKLSNLEQGIGYRTGHYPRVGANEFSSTAQSARWIMPEFKPVSSVVVAAIERPGCTKCGQHRMLLSKLEQGASGFASRTFECQKCGHICTATVSDDPMSSGALGWLASELRPPT
jgi:hypothetical protein